MKTRSTKQTHNTKHTILKQTLTRLNYIMLKHNIKHTRLNKQNAQHETHTTKRNKILNTQYETHNNANIKTIRTTQH